MTTLSTPVEQSAHGLAPAEQATPTGQLPSSLADHAHTQVDLKLVRGLNYFWLLTIAATLIAGDVTTSQHDQLLWHSWRGPAMVLLSLAFLVWYLYIILDTLRARL